MADSSRDDSEYGGADGLYGNVDRGNPLDPWREAVAYRRSARRGDVVGNTPQDPAYGTGGAAAS